MATLQMLVPWNFTRCMLGLPCGFSVYFVVVAEPCGIVLAPDKIGELLCFLEEQLLKLVNG